MATSEEMNVEVTTLPRLSWRRVRLPFRRDVLSRIGAALLLAYVLVGAFGSWLPLGDPEAVNVGPRLAAPGSRWLAGTDSLGRSVLPRLAEGIRTTFLLAGTAVLVTAAVSVVLGMVAAYYRGPVVPYGAGYSAGWQPYQGFYYQQPRFGLYLGF